MNDRQHPDALHEGISLGRILWYAQHSTFTLTSLAPHMSASSMFHHLCSLHLLPLRSLPHPANHHTTRPPQQTWTQTATATPAPRPRPVNLYRTTNITHMILTCFTVVNSSLSRAVGPRDDASSVDSRDVGRVPPPPAPSPAGGLGGAVDPAQVTHQLRQHARMRVGHTLLLPDLH